MRLAIVRSFDIHERAYELRRYLRDDRIAESAQLSHSTGYPISQRGKSGFNWPRFSVCALEPFDA